MYKINSNAHVLIMTFCIHFKNNDQTSCTLKHYEKKGFAIGLANAFKTQCKNTLLVA